MNSKRAVIVLSALAHDSRLAIFHLLVKHSPDELNAGAISEKLHIPKASLSFHLKEMSCAGLISRRHNSRFMHYAAVIPAMDELIDYLTAYRASIVPAPQQHQRLTYGSALKVVTVPRCSQCTDMASGQCPLKAETDIACNTRIDGYGTPA